MPIRPIVVQRKYQRIADEIVKLMDAGEFEVGTRLPGERVLAAMLDVSRTTLREALSALELDRRVEIRVGSGVYVLPLPRKARKRSAHTPLGSEMSPFDVLHARRVIEAETAALAATRATPVHLRGIESAFARLVADMQADRKSSPGDRLFHVRIAGASGNSALAGVVASLWEQQTRPLTARLESLFVTTRRKRDNIAEHRRIVDAIRARDPAAARRAMRRHLTNAERQRMVVVRDGR